MTTEIRVANTDASMPVLFQLVDSSTIVLVNERGKAMVLVADPVIDLSKGLRVGDILEDFCQVPSSGKLLLAEEIDLRLGKPLPIGTELSLIQS